ncbi:glycerophosphodiester phosphodiesterase [Enterococcus canintestini]|uniref:Hydrolase n=1 Tax=Enterococcus canintestini TaxID=317010 RepID=A0A267HTW7_9ENTE|nr:glycerophosphodiester phosphodiesterase [Enterococcus canintestini]PAB01811.1 hydrolase [Enterococcus canintestini]
MRHKKNNTIRPISVAFLLVILVILIFNLFIFLSNKNATAKIYSHRGASGEEIEHTFSAYDLAILYGSKFIEQDLVTSKDGTLYISHDLSAKRITGVNKNFSDMTDSEINNLKTANGDRILKLQDVFNKYKDKVHYVIELKENDLQTSLFKKITKDNNLENNIIVQASNVKALNNLEAVFPDMKKLLLVNTQDKLESGVKEKNVDIISAEKKLMTTDNVELVHKHNKEFNVWTLNTTKEIENAIKLRVDTYFTNYTAKAIALEKKFFYKLSI